MDRKLIYAGAIPLDTDLLGAEKNAYIGLAKLAEAILGTATVAAGFAASPESPTPGWGIVIGEGQIYSQEQTDTSAYGSLGTDSTLIVKQGLYAGATLTEDSSSSPLSAPASGYNRCYLVQAQFVANDTDNTVLPYYNSSNPSMAWNGPGNSGSSQPTLRNDTINIEILKGTDTTGTPTVPTPTSGWVGLWVITLSGTSTAITSGTISAYSGSPVIANTLTELAPLASPALTGTPTVPTQALLDNSSKAASTQFVQQNAGGMAGVTSITGATTLTTANAGQLIAAGGSGGYTVTLAAVSAMPAGKGFKLVNISTGTMTVDAAGSDSIQLGASSVSGLTLGPGDVVELYSNNTSAYQVADNTLTKIGALATVVFDGTGTGTLTPIRSQNVTSVVKSGTGEYIITVPFNWPSSTPCMSIVVKQATGSHGYSLGPGDSYTCGEVSFTSNSVTIVTRAEGLDNNGVGSSNQADVSYISVIFF